MSKNTAIPEPMVPVSNEVSRRTMMLSLAAAGLCLGGGGAAAWSQAGTDSFADGRPKIADRKFRSAAVEEFLVGTRRSIGDPMLASLFVNCFPNTLDTTVEPGSFEGEARYGGDYG